MAPMRSAVPCRITHIGGRSTFSPVIVSMPEQVIGESCAHLLLSSESDHSSWVQIGAPCLLCVEGRETERHVLGILDLDVFRAPRVYFRHPLLLTPLRRVPAWLSPVAPF
jgi:hypothetical protein